MAVLDVVGAVATWEHVAAKANIIQPHFQAAKVAELREWGHMWHFFASICCLSHKYKQAHIWVIFYT